MTAQILYKECPLCNQGSVVLADNGSVYRCEQCQLGLKEQAMLGIFKKVRYVVTSFGPKNYTLAMEGLSNVALGPDQLKVAIGNVYTDEELAKIAEGSFETLRPVRTILAEIILEQLLEACFIQVTELRRGHGQALPELGNYQPTIPVPRQGMDWQDDGNLFCTTHRLVFPSNSFTFIRTDRKIVGLQAFTDGIAVQRKGEGFATYFVGCHPHEAALVTAYVMGKVPKLRAEPTP